MLRGVTGRHWLALAILGSGFTTVAAMTLYAKGRKQEAFALAFTAGVLSTAFAAARALNDPGSSRVGDPNGGPQTAPGGMDSSAWGIV